MNVPAAVTALGEVLDALALVDHHVHGAFAADIDRDALEEAITESDRAAAPGVSSFDSQLGFALLRWCAPLLDLPPHAAPEAYAARRLELGAGEVNRRLLSAAGIGYFLVDTGLRGDELLGVDAMAAASGQRAAEVVRLEALGEEVANAGVTAAAWADTVRRRLAERLEAGAVGTKSIVAYRHGLDVPAERPEAAAVTGSAGRWLADVARTGRARLTDPVLLSWLLWTGIDAGVPLQIHTGFGDTDLHLARANPLLLTDFFKLTERAGTPIVLLHCYPYHREAGYLAQMFPCVYFDVGVAVNYLGAQSRQVVAESLEVAPFAKQLFSTDAFGPSELHLLGAQLWRRAFAAVVGDWVDADDWSAAEAARVARMIGVDNATALYRLASPG
ncbi:MAG TPA: amidohydrolase family protein [Acidimicrobiales bacterium]|nr:amidohydrolase family protein [Acidimicrobiales bacterium]